MLFYSINMYHNSTKNNDTYCKISDKYKTQKSENKENSSLFTVQKNKERINFTKFH